MPTPSEANTSIVRAYTTLQMQTMNHGTSQSLQQVGRLERNYAKLARDGEDIAKEITNRLADYTNDANKKMYCDARKWVNKDVKDYGSAGYGGLAINREVLPDDKYKLVVEYNNTTGGTRHYWNLVIQKKLEGYVPARFVRSQVAHFSMYSRVDAPTPSRTDYTILGAFHLKDELSKGVLDATQTAIDKTKTHAHAAGLIPHVDAKPAVGGKPAVPFEPAQITTSFRRYFINSIGIPRVPARPANAATGTPAKPEIPPRVEYKIGLQNQVGKVSEMTSHFGRVAVTVLQEYFDAGFSTAGFTTPANPENFVARKYCKPPAAAAYTELTDIGEMKDIAEPHGRKERERAKKAAIARGLDPTKPANIVTIAAEEDAAEAAGRLAKLRALPPIGGKRKTRRTKRQRRSTQKRR